MIPRKNRISSVFFTKLFSKGFYIDSPLFSLRYFKKTRQDFGVAVIVSNKVSGNSVRKNLLRRRFFALILQNKDLVINNGSYLFYPKKEAFQASPTELSQSITKALHDIYEKNS